MCVMGPEAALLCVMGVVIEGKWNFMLFLLVEGNAVCVGGRPLVEASGGQLGAPVFWEQVKG